MGLPLRKRICRRHKSGLPKTSSNHKSDTGPPQCPDPSAATPKGFSRRRKADPIATCDGGKVGPCGFRQGAPVARSPCRKQYGRKTKDPRRLFASKSAGPACSGLRFKRFRKARNGKRYHGKVRNTPRRFGGGRHRHRASSGQWPASGGHNFRHPNRRAAAEFLPPATVGGCRREKI